MREPPRTRQLARVLTTRTAVNSFWAYALQATNLLVSLVMLPYLTRVLGRDGYGTYAAALNWMTYFSIVTAWGFDMWGSREVARLSSTEDVGSLFSRIFMARTYLLLGVTPAYLTFCLLLDGQQRGAAFALLLNLVGLTYGQTWLFLGRQKLKLAAIAALVSKVPLLACIAILVRSPGDTILFCLIFGCSALLSAATQEFLARSVFKVKIQRVALRQVWQDLVAAGPMFAANIMATISNGVGVTVLSLSANRTVVGEYAGVLRLANTLLVLFAPIWTSLYPAACRRYEISEKEGHRFALRIARVLVPLFFILTFGLALIRHEVVVVILGAEFAAANGVLVPLMAWVFLGVVANIFGTLILVASGHQRAFSITLGISTVSLVLATFALARFEAVGIGWAAAIGQFVNLLAIGIVITQLQSRTRERTLNAHGRE